MSLEHAVLGLLSYRPYSGYDLKKIFDTSVRHFWPADQSQIYRTLSRMTENQWVNVEAIRQETRPDRKVYHITESGRQELREWLVMPLPFEERRSADMIQIFFAGQLSDEEVLMLFERAATHMREGLAMYESIPQHMEAYQDHVHSPREFYFWMLTLDIGKHTLRASLAWIEEMLVRVRAGDIPPV